MLFSSSEFRSISIPLFAPVCDLQTSLQTSPWLQATDNSMQHAAAGWLQHCRPPSSIILHLTLSHTDNSGAISFDLFPPFQTHTNWCCYVPKNVHHFYSKFKWKRLELYQVSQQPALAGCLKDPHGSHLSTDLHTSTQANKKKNRYFLCPWTYALTNVMSKKLKEKFRPTIEMLLHLFLWWKSALLLSYINLIRIQKVHL